MNHLQSYGITGKRKEPLPNDPTKLRIGIFAPPLVEAFQPSLTLPYLTAQMKNFGFIANCHNLSSLFYIWLFRRVRLESMGIYTSLRHAMTILRDTNRFYQPNYYHDSLAYLEEFVADIAKEDGIPYTLYPASQVSITNEKTDFSILVKSMEGSLLEKFLLDYVGFTLRLENFDVIGFSANNTFQLLSSVFIAKKLKQAKISAHLILGGHAVSIADNVIIKNEVSKSFDSIVLSGGGDVFAQICEDLVENNKKRFYQSCDISPRYRQTIGQFLNESPYQLTLQHDINDLYLSPHQVFSIHSALGCHYGNCTFCSSNRKSTPYLPRDIRVLVDEIEYLHEHYQISHFIISDNNFDPKRAERFCEELENREKRIYWQCTSRVYDTFNTPLLKRMKDAGCVLLNVGLESASDSILKKMKKGYTVKQAGQMLINMKEAGMPVHLYCICGFPGETQEDSQKTIDFIKKYSGLYHSIYFQNYDAQLANKVFADELGAETQGYSASKMIDTLMQYQDFNRTFAVHKNLMRRSGYPFIEDHNFLYLAREFNFLKNHKDK